MSNDEETDETRSDELLDTDGWIDKWTEAVAPKPDAAPDVHVLWGFVGTSSLEDHTRLYLDLRAQYAVDIPRREIVHREPLGEDVSKLGGSILWITSQGWRTARYRTPHHR